MTQSEVLTKGVLGLNGRSIDYPRGKVLGGSSCINGGVWTRGSRDDFDRFANVTGDDGWSWDALRPFILGVEQLVPPADGHNTEGEIIPSIHGHHGLVGISVQEVLTGIDDMVIQTTSKLSEFPFNEDMNSGNTIGISWGQYAIRNGTRQDAANTYLEPASNQRNLDVLINTQVTKVVQTGEKDGVPVINGVEFAQNSTSHTYSINATKEVILSAGSLNTPQILFLSGLGPTSNLTDLSIPTVVDLPYLGSNFQDHVAVISVWSVNANFTWDDIYRNATLYAETLEEWETERTGVFAAGILLQFGWLRLPDNDTIFESVPDPSAGPTSAHYEMVFANDYAAFSAGGPPATGHYMSIVTNLVSPTSRGSLTINSTSPWDPPVIDPGLLNSDFDTYTIVESFKAARRYVASPAFSDYIIEEVLPANATTDAELTQYARDNSGTAYHPSGTTAMSAWNDTSSGVVNPDLTVKGTKGLRVVDAGIMPFVPAAHTQATIYIIAERAAAMIKGSV